MNNRDRRKLVMAKRYAKLDQRKQESMQMKAENKRFEAEMDFVMYQNHPMAKIARELIGKWDRGHRDHIANWHLENPELSAQLKEYIEQAQNEFKELHK